MCAMDRSSHDGLSQSVRDVISCVKSLYHNSPVSVCIRNERHEPIYFNDSFQQLFSFFKAESEKKLFKAGFVSLEYVLAQFEFDCISLGQGCVLCKDFYCSDYSFQVRMESLFIPGESSYVLWQINLRINLPLTGRPRVGQSVHNEDNIYDNVISRIPVKNMESLSFFILGFSYRESAGYIGLPASTVRKRVEKAREIIVEFFASYENFKAYLFKSRKIFFFLDYCSNIISVKKL